MNKVATWPRASTSHNVVPAQAGIHAEREVTRLSLRAAAGHTQHGSRRSPGRRLVMPLALAVALLATGCYREERPTKAPPAASTTAGRSYAASTQAPAKDRYEENAYAVSQGKSLFRAYNCAGCHAAGGGGIGPALMDSKWRYGSDPESIFTTISQGRPNGMPAFGEHVPEDQIWQLVAYVRSLSGQLRSDVAPSRGDNLQASKPEGRRKKEMPTHEQTPAVNQ